MRVLEDVFWSQRHMWKLIQNEGDITQKLFAMRLNKQIVQQMTRHTMIILSRGIMFSWLINNAHKAKSADRKEAQF